MKEARFAAIACFRVTFEPTALPLYPMTMTVLASMNPNLGSAIVKAPGGKLPVSLVIVTDPLLIFSPPTVHPSQGTPTKFKVKLTGVGAAWLGATIPVSPSVIATDATEVFPSFCVTLFGRSRCIAYPLSTVHPTETLGSVSVSPHLFKYGRPCRCYQFPGIRPPSRGLLPPCH